jgi:hypothetical protein
MTVPHELTNEEVAAFEKDNPDIRLKVVEYSQQLFELGIASGDMPDLFRVEAKQLPGMAKDGLRGRSRCRGSGRAAGCGSFGGVAERGVE